jgi:putative nucleotidyltransferase with HDIG domain
MVLVFRRNKKPNLIHNRADGKREMTEYQSRLGLLCDIAEEANSITQVSTLLERILKITQHTVDASIVSVFMKDEVRSRIHLPITVSRYDDEMRRQAVAVASEIADLIASSTTPLLSNNLAAELRFNAEIRKNADNIIKSIIATPILKGQKVIGVLVAANKDNGHSFTQRDFEVLKGFGATEALILLVSLERTAIENVGCLNPNQVQMEGYRNIVHELASTIDVKDAQVYAHARRTKEYALLAANSLPLTPKELQAIEFGALLHDIGKIGIDSEILCKPGPLNDEEWKIIHEHPQKGADILKDIPHLKDATNIVLCHHERYDGTGYPKKLKGDEIPIGARLVAVANAFDTMTTDNPYRTALSKDEAIKELIDNTATQFCPRAVEAFVAAFKKHQGKVSVAASPKEIKPKEANLSPVLMFDRFKNTQNLIIRVKKEVKEAERLKRKAEKAVREAKKKGKKAAKEARIRAERKAKEFKIMAVKEAKEANIKAGRESREAKILKAEENKEASEARIKVEKETKLAEILKAKEDKEAKEAKIKAERETRLAEILKSKADKGAKKAEILKAKAEKEAKAAQIEKAEREARQAQILKAKAEKAAAEAKIKTEKEVKAARTEKTEKEARQAQILKAKAEKAAAEVKIKTEKEAKIKAEILKARAEKEARESRIKAEREARQAQILKAKAEKAAAEVKIKAEKEAKIKAEILRAKAEKEAKIKAEILRAKAEREAKEAKIRAEREARQAQILKARAEKEAKEASKSKKAEQLRKANNKFEEEVFTGNIRLVVPITESSDEVQAFGQDLEKIQGVKILMLSHSEEEGHLLLLGLQKPMNLIQFIKEMPLVENIYKKGGTISIFLRDGQN